MKFEWSVIDGKWVEWTFKRIRTGVEWCIYSITGVKWVEWEFNVMTYNGCWMKDDRQTSGELTVNVEWKGVLLFTLPMNWARTHQASLTKNGLFLSAITVTTLGMSKRGCTTALSMKNCLFFSTIPPREAFFFKWGKKKKNNPIQSQRFMDTKMSTFWFYF